MARRGMTWQRLTRGEKSEIWRAAGCEEREEGQGGAEEQRGEGRGRGGGGARARVAGAAMGRLIPV